MSLDGETSIVVIALVGNPFSPAYARARAKASPALPLAFSAMNVALVTRGAKFWSLTERPIREGDRTGHGIAIGRSTMEWKDDALVIALDERTAPFGRRIRGRITLRTRVRTDLELHLDAGQKHRWWPVAPVGDIEVSLEEPGIRFVGHGYHDANIGLEPLDVAFERWSWSRARVGVERHGAQLTYDVLERAGTARTFGLDVSSSGRVQVREDLTRTALPTSRWGLDRSILAPPQTRARLVRSLEDGPFYARAIVTTGSAASSLAMHEQLSLDRLRRSWVRFLSGFRMRTER